MRITTALLLAGLALPVALVPSAASTQEEGKGQEDNPFLRNREPRKTLAELENERITEEIQGAWVMTNYYRSDTIVPSEEFRGFAMFADGYMTFTFQALEDHEDFFFPENQYVVQSAAFRYRMYEGTQLQVAGMMGFTNANEDYELEFQTTKVPREYAVVLNEDFLSLRRLGGVGFDFRRMREAPFPEAAAEQLRRQRGGLGLYDVLEDREGERRGDDGDDGR